MSPPSGGSPGTILDRVWRAAFWVAYRLARAWWFVRRPSVRGAYVALWCGDELLLIRNSYKRGETVPCGGIGRRESPRAAARRELREEVGIVLDESDLLPVFESLVEFDFTHDHCFFFEATLPNRPLFSIDRREVIWADFVRADELAGRPLVPHVQRYLAARQHENRAQ